MTTAKINLPRRLIGIFTPPRGSVQYRALYGGRGSAKSFSAALMAAVWGYAEPMRILCTREFQASIRESFFAELKAAIGTVPWLADHYDVGIDYIRGKNGTEFIFRGLRRNEQSIKSLAKIDLTIVEEAEDVPENSWLALEATVFRQPRSELWAVWNPREEGSPVDKRFRRSPPPNALITEINYSDNPFFPAGLETLRQREQQRLDPATYAHIWEGAYLQNSNAQVFHGKVDVREFEPDNWDGPYLGGDFGFSQDPTAAVECWLNGEDVFIRREMFRKGLELDDTPQAVTSAIPGFERQVSRWDNARPESISHMRRHGLPMATSVDKWPGSVEDGIAFLRSFRRIVIHPDCPNMQREARLYSYKVNDAGDPTTKIVDAQNHGWDACIAEGELVWTSRGHVPVQDVSAGDMVMTRYGYRRVIAAGLTGNDRDVVRVITSRGSVVCTPDHKIWTKNGWTRADALRYNDETIGEVLSCEKQLVGMGKNGIAGLIPPTGQTGNIIKKPAPAALTAFIGSFGKRHMATSLMAITSITSMATVATTGLKTWSASLRLSTQNDTRLRATGLSATCAISTTSGRLHQLGTDQRQPRSFTSALPKNLGKILSQQTQNAISAARITRSTLGMKTQSFAAMLASLLRVGSQALTMWPSNVRNAASRSGPTNTQRKGHAPDYVVRVERLSESARVYDISVEGCPEFFAGGVLVHNCRYALAPLIRRKGDLKIRSL